MFYARTMPDYQIDAILDAGYWGPTGGPANVSMYDLQRVKNERANGMGRFGLPKLDDKIAMPGFDTELSRLNFEKMSMTLKKQLYSDKNHFILSGGGFEDGEIISVSPDDMEFFGKYLEQGNIEVEQVQEIFGDTGYDLSKHRGLFNPESNNPFNANLENDIDWNDPTIYKLPDDFAHPTSTEFQEQVYSEGALSHWLIEERVVEWLNDWYDGTGIEFAEAKGATITDWGGTDALEILIGEQKEGEGKTFMLEGQGFNSGTIGNIVTYIEETTKPEKKISNLEYLSKLIPEDVLMLDGNFGDTNEAQFSVWMDVINSHYIGYTASTNVELAREQQERTNQELQEEGLYINPEDISGHHTDSREEEEIDKEYYDKAKHRVDELTKQTTMF